MKKLLIVLSIILFAIAFAHAADVNLRWDEADGADEYIIYQSTDNGATWDSGTNVGNVLSYTLAGVPDSGLVLMRIASRNATAEALTAWSGAFYNGDWRPPDFTPGLGIN